MQNQALSSNSKVQPVHLVLWRMLQCSPAGFFLIAFVSIISGCTTSNQVRATSDRPFNFQTDTFAYPNQLVWDYYFDNSGKWVSRPHEPKPDYSHHCFVVSRSSKQFFQNAKFDTNQPVADAATYQNLVKRIVSLSPRHVPPDTEKITIPGYADLRSFSAAHADILKAECGSAWQSYLQRGHWRMILPFSRHHQEQMASQLVIDLKANIPPVVHVVRFPQLSINHSVLLFGAHETEQDIRFDAYDPNNPFKPVTLTYDRKTKTFSFPGNDYWRGGRVDIYEVYRGWAY